MRCWMDGGSTDFIIRNSDGEVLTIQFTQYVNFENNLDQLPGRIYLNSKLIEAKSKEEEKIICEFESPIFSHEFPRGEISNGKAIINDFLNYFKSEKYPS